MVWKGCMVCSASDPYGAGPHLLSPGPHCHCDRCWGVPNPGEGAACSARYRNPGPGLYPTHPGCHALCTQPSASTPLQLGPRADWSYSPYPGLGFMLLHNRVDCESGAVLLWISLVRRPSLDYTISFSHLRLQDNESWRGTKIS